LTLFWLEDPTDNGNSSLIGDEFYIPLEHCFFDSCRVGRITLLLLDFFSNLSFLPESLNIITIIDADY
jgi:hypothetical protein